MRSYYVPLAAIRIRCLKSFGQTAWRFRPLYLGSLPGAGSASSAARKRTLWRKPSSGRGPPYLLLCGGSDRSGLAFGFGVGTLVQVLLDQVAAWSFLGARALARTARPRSKHDCGRCADLVGALASSAAPGPPEQRGRSRRTWRVAANLSTSMAWH